MKINVTKHYKDTDFSKTDEIWAIDIYVGKNLIAEYDNYAEYCYNGFVDALRYIHGKNLLIIENCLNDYITRG